MYSPHPSSPTHNSQTHSDVKAIRSNTLLDGCLEEDVSDIASDAVTDDGDQNKRKKGHNKHNTYNWSHDRRSGEGGEREGGREGGREREREGGREREREREREGEREREREEREREKEREGERKRERFRILSLQHPYKHNIDHTVTQQECKQVENHILLQ